MKKGIGDLGIGTVIGLGIALVVSFYNLNAAIAIFFGLTFNVLLRYRSKNKK